MKANLINPKMLASASTKVQSFSGKLTIDLGGVFNALIFYNKGAVYKIIMTEFEMEKTGSLAGFGYNLYRYNIKNDSLEYGTKSTEGALTSEYRPMERHEVVTFTENLQDTIKLVKGDWRKYPKNLAQHLEKILSKIETGEKEIL
ncbi:MAG: hypothetical protein ABIH00_11505 [Armatimonadota bacterium]